MSGTVLIIEDDTRIANWVKLYFERAGFVVEVAYDGESGLALARDLTPDLIILDLTLPRLDGVALCRILRGESEVPIIMLTAREAHAERVIGLDSGADDYIVKPFDPEEVMARAGAVLRRVKGRVQQALTRGGITLDEAGGGRDGRWRAHSLDPGADCAAGDVHASSQPGAQPRTADRADLQSRIRWVRPRHRQPGRAPAKADQPRWQPADSDCLRRRLQVCGGGGVMSLRWRIMGSLVAVILLSVLISVGVGYYATQHRLGVFVDRIGDDEAVQLARNLSRAYSGGGGWETVERALAEAGYSYAEAEQRERSEEREGEHIESLHRDPVRVVIVAADGGVVKDNMSALLPGTAAPDLGGHRETVIDLATDRTVGHVYVDVNRELLSTESDGFLSRLLYISLIGGALTAGVAILLAVWLSKRITAPVTALTEATQAIAEGGTARLPVTAADELGRMSAAFNRMASALKTQRELRRRLISDVSHELNTPLSVILLEATGLRDGLQSASGASGQIIEEVGRLRGLATDLDWLAETDHGELRLKVEASSIDDLLKAEVDRWQPQAEARQVDLSLEAPADLPEMAFDRMRMGQALGNVLNNAVHCAEAGGRVVVGAGLEENGGLAISISDDGIGIDPADLPHLFDRFYRTDRSRSRGIGGTGLGLAITRAIVEAHGGYDCRDERRARTGCGRDSSSPPRWVRSVCGRFCLFPLLSRCRFHGE